MKMWRQLSRWRLNLAGVVVICGAIATMAVMLGRAPRHRLRRASPRISAHAVPKSGSNLEHRYRTATRATPRSGPSGTSFRTSEAAFLSMLAPTIRRPKTIRTSAKTTLGWSGVAIGCLRDFAPEYARYRPRTHFFGLFVSDVSNVAKDFYIPTLWPLGASDNRAYAARDGGRVEVRKVRTQVRQAILDYFHRHNYVIVGKYMGVDTRNLVPHPREFLIAGPNHPPRCPKPGRFRTGSRCVYRKFHRAPNRGLHSTVGVTKPTTDPGGSPKPPIASEMIQA